MQYIGDLPRPPNRPSKRALKRRGENNEGRLLLGYQMLFQHFISEILPSGAGLRKLFAPQ
jgi:hypothetical protein